MYAIDIIIENKNIKEKYDQQYDDWYHLACSYIYFLERNGQIVKNNHQFIINENVLKIPVLCFEKNSLSLEHCSIYNKEQVVELEQLSGCKIAFELQGRDGENPQYAVPQNSSFYVLRIWMGISFAQWRYKYTDPIVLHSTHRPCWD
ncbi:MAG: DUF2310 family Zn-ribbon-containing protein [Saprospiraceae bacterium]